MGYTMYFSLGQTMQYLAEIDHVLIYTAIILSAILHFARHLGWVKVISSFLLSIVLVLVDAPYMLAETIFPPEKNPQIITVFLCSIFISLALLTCCSRRFRTFDRIFISGIAISILITGLIFHYALVQTVLPKWSKDAAWGRSYLVSLEPEELYSQCESTGLGCWLLDRDSIDEIPIAIRMQVQGVHEFYTNSELTSSFGFGFGAFNDLSEDGVAVVLYYADPGEPPRVISDSKTGIRIHSTIRDLFYLLSSIAHAVWLFGGLLLLSFHKRKLKRRLV